MNAPEKPVAARGYPDLHEHLAELKKRGLLLEISRAIDKDAELHPLVRWQFVGGMDEAERKAFLFTNIVDGRGRKYDIPVVVGAIAANRAIYSVGMGAPLSGIQGKWDRAIARPIPPREVKDAPCHEVVHQGQDLQGEGRGSTVCRSRSRRRDSTRRPRSRRPTSSRATPRPACRTWAPTAPR